MYNYSGALRNLMLVAACFFLLFSGCDKQAEPPATKTVISKKIDMSGKKAAPDGETGQKAETGSDKTGTPGAAQVAPSEAAKSGNPVAGTTAGTVAQPEALVNVYDPTGKIDPFETVFKKRETADASLENQAKKRKRIPLTPLEQIELSQLKLVAVMIAPSGSRAMVEEASGKGYIIQNGTYIGKNSGRVIDILLDKIVVEEEVEDILGKLVIRKSEMKLQKVAGE